MLYLIWGEGFCPIPVSFSRAILSERDFVQGDYVRGDFVRFPSLQSLSNKTDMEKTSVTLSCNHVSFELTCRLVS